MEDQTAILTGSLQADPFKTEIRGYHKRQVEEYLKRTHQQTAALEARLATALDAAEQARRELAVLQEQHQQSTARPAHEEVSERLSQILRLAAEEAEQERTKAEEEIGRHRTAAEEEIDRLVGSARAEADDLLASAREEADRELSHARDEAQQLLASARAEAETALTEARDHAERLRAQAERRAATINGQLTERLDSLTRSHVSALRRLEEIRDTLVGVLDDEASAGPIAVRVTDLDDAGEDSGVISAADLSRSVDPDLAVAPDLPVDVDGPADPAGPVAPAGAVAGPGSGSASGSDGGAGVPVEPATADVDLTVIDLTEGVPTADSIAALADEPRNASR